MIDHIQHKDIERLLRLLRSRDLSKDEWSQLEAYTTDDPFLSDAVEGLRQVPADSRIAHIQSILSGLSTAGRKRKTVLSMSPWVSIAASVLLLVGMFWLANRFMTTDLDQVAENITQDEDINHETTDNEAALIPPPPSSEEMDEAEPQDGIASTAPAFTHPKPNGEKMETPDHHNSPVVSLQTYGSNASRDESASDSAPMEKARKQTDNQPPSILAAPATTGNAAEYLTIADPEVKGIVMNFVGEPVGGAQVQIKGTAVQTQTDYQGNFALDIPNYNYRNALIISHEEYPPVEADVADGDSIVVRLQETLAAGKSDIITLSQRRMSTSSGPGSRSLALPVTGERSYNKYLRQNLRFPSQASIANIRGSVIVEFDISADGSPQNFRIVRSLGFGCDEEAIRLIREGPKWNVSGAQVPIGRWEIVF